MAGNKNFQVDSELDFSSLSYSPEFSPVDYQQFLAEESEEFVESLLGVQRASSPGNTGPIPPSVEIVGPNDEVGSHPVLILLEPRIALTEEPVVNNRVSEIRQTRNVLNEPRIDYEAYLQQQQCATITTSSYVPESEPEAVADAEQEQIPNQTDVEVEIPTLHILTWEEFLKELCDSSNTSSGLPQVWEVDPATAAAIFDNGLSAEDAALQENISITLLTGPSTSTECILGLPAGWAAESNNSMGLQEQPQILATDEPEGVVPPSPPNTDQPGETVKKSRKPTAKNPDAKKPAPKKRTTKTPDAKKPAPKKSTTKTPDAKKPAPKKRTTKTPDKKKPAPKKRTSKDIKKSPEEEREEYLQARQRNTESTRRSREAKRVRMNAMLERIKELEKERVALTNGIHFYQYERERLTRELEMKRARLQNPQNK